MTETAVERGRIAGAILGDSMETVEGHVWEPIELGWGQKLAAFWSIAWPAHMTVFGAVLLLAVFRSSDAAPVGIWSGLLGAVLYLSALPLWVHRLVQKRYRSFRIAVERPDGTNSNQLSMRESLEVAVPIIALQGLYVLALSAVFSLLGGRFDAQTSKDLQTLAIWGRILIVGPYAMRWAIAFRYESFACRHMRLRSLRRWVRFEQSGMVGYSANTYATAGIDVDLRGIGDCRG